MASEDARWYVVHTYSGYENKVAQNIEKIVENRGLRDQILDVKIPTGVFTEMKDDKKVEVERKLFPGYVLIKMVMNEDTWYIARNTRGVTGFVGPGSKPVPLSEAEVEALGVEVREIEVSYSEGDTVKVIDGSFEGFTGKVSEISKERGKVSVLITMMGRETPIEFDLDQVAAVEE
ncbi:MAG: transcription termination/antitermination protein NusG [Clostridia bacterium]|nr:transcription termination/antitermination protein NusG [Clostridia bacterium]